MSDVDEIYTCVHCDFEPLEPRKTVEDNEVQVDGWYCPDCEHEYDEAPTPWEDQQFPLWIEVEHYEDNWGMLRNVSRRTGLPDEKIPSGEMKYTVFYAWFKVEADGSVVGPFDEKRGEKL